MLFAACLKTSLAGWKSSDRETVSPLLTRSGMQFGFFVFRRDGVGLGFMRFLFLSFFFLLQFGPRGTFEGRTCLFSGGRVFLSLFFPPLFSWLLGVRSIEYRQPVPGANIPHSLKSISSPHSLLASGFVSIWFK